MDETTLYFYLLSTISQTLGAIMGLLSVFLVFRIQFLENRWEKVFSKLMETGKGLHVDPVFLVAPDDQALNSVRVRVEQWEADPGRRKDIWVIQGRTLLESYDQIRASIKNIMRAFTLLALLSFIVIVTSVFGIAINWYPSVSIFTIVCHVSFWGFLLNLFLGLVFIVYALKGAPLFSSTRPSPHAHS